MHVDIKEEPQFNEDFDVDFDQSEYHISQSCLEAAKKSSDIRAMAPIDTGQYF